DVVRGFDSGIAGVVVVEFPSRDRAVGVYTAGDVDNAGGSKVCPGELLFTGPNQLHRLVSRGCEACRFEGGLTGVFAAVAGAGIGDNHAHLALRYVERFGQLAANSERALRAGPYGELVARPLRHGGARLERNVG